MRLFSLIFSALIGALARAQFMTQVAGIGLARLFWQVLDVVRGILALNFWWLIPVGGALPDRWHPLPSHGRHLERLLQRFVCTDRVCRT
jgi:hypothetical protein